MEKRTVLIAGIIGLFLAAGIGRVFAEEQAGGTGNIKQEITQDKQQLGEQKQAISEHAQAARTEEGQLREQVHQAIQSGNMEKAKELKDQLKAAHQENIQEKQADMQAMRENRKDLKQDMKAVEGQRPLPFNIGKGVQRMQSMPKGKEGPPPPERQTPLVQGQPGAEAPAMAMPPAMKKEAAMRDRMEDRHDKREDVRDRREDIRDRREDIRDEQHQGGLRDKMEDIRDRREDVRDRREDRRDLREDRRDMREGRSGGAGQARGAMGGGKGGQRGGGGGRPQRNR